MQPKDSAEKTPENNRRMKKKLDKMIKDLAPQYPLCKSLVRSMNNRFYLLSRLFVIWLVAIHLFIVKSQTCRRTLSTRRTASFTAPRWSGLTAWLSGWRKWGRKERAFHPQVSPVWYPAERLPGTGSQPTKGHCQHPYLLLNDMNVCKIHCRSIWLEASAKWVNCI